MKFPALFLALLLSGINVFAQTGWRKITSPVADTLVSMEFGSSQTGYACGRNGCVIKTTNAGGSWAALTSPVSEDLYDVHAVSSTILFLCGDNGKIVKSVNGGSSWSLQTSGVTAGLRCVFMVNANNGIVAGDSGTVLNTVNGGATWIVLSPVTQEALVDVQMTSSTTGYICGNSGTVLKTIDGGLNWNPLVVPTSENLNCVLFADSLNGFICGNNGAMLQTVDGGVNWIQLNIPYLRDFYEILQPASATLILTSDDDWSVVSYNSGATWKIFYGGAQSIYGGGITTSTSTNIYGIGADGNIFKANFSDWTMDNHYQYTGMIVNDITFTDSLRGYAATQNGVYRTTDALHWNLVSIPGTYLTGIDFPTAAIGYVCDGNTAGIFKTLDSGATWTPVSCPGQDGEDIWFLDALTGFYANGDLYKTTDGGASWTLVYSGPYDVIRVESTAQDTIFALTAQSWLYRSLDGGLNWRPVYAPNYAGYTSSSINFVSSNVGYFTTRNAGNQSIYKTVDGGENWFPVLYRYTGGSVEDIQFISEDTGYAVGRNGSNTPFAMKTIDGGYTWTAMTFASNFGEVQCVYYPDPRHGFLGSTPTSANIPICAYQCDDPTNTIPGGVFTEVSAVGPPPSWVWAESTGGDEVNCSVTDRDGNTVVAGYKNLGPMQVGTQTLSCPSTAVTHVTQYDSSGNVLWAVPLCNDGNRIYIYDVDVDTSGNIYLAGEAGGTLTLGSFTVSSWALNAPNAFIAKISPAGTPLWLRQIASPNQGLGAAWGIKVTPAQELIVTGTCSEQSIQFGSVTLNTPYTSGYWVAKYTTAGTAIWAVSPGTSGNYRNYEPMTVDSAGDVLIANTYSMVYWGGDTLLSMNSATGINTDILLAKISGQNGSELWHKTINGIQFNTPRDIAIDENNNIYLAGTIEDAARFDSTWKSGVHFSDGFIARFNPQGDLVWARTEGSIDHQDITSVICGPGGMIYYAGHTQNVAHFNDTIIVSPAYGSFFVAACNSGGQLVWIISASPASGPLGDPHWFASAWGIGLDADSNVYVSGNFKNTGNISSSVVNMTYVGKLNQPVIGNGPSVVLDTTLIAETALRLYPNPSTDQCVLNFTSQHSGESRITILDVSGKTVRTADYTTTQGVNKAEVNIEGLAPGTYIVVLDGPVIASRSLIVQ